MKIHASFLAVRAIGSRFARNLWSSNLILTSIISVILLAIIGWLVHLNAWWWLLAAPVGIGISVAIVVFIVFHLLINYVQPVQTPKQKQQIAAFVDRLQLLSEITSTPKFIMLFRTIRSIAAPKSETYLQDIFETKDLKSDFQKIVQSFQSE